MLDIIYLYKLSNTEELKYSLRSIERNLPHKKVYIVGDRPDWIQNITHIPIADLTSTKGINTAFKLKQISLNPNIDENFAVFCDDYFILKPIKDIEHYHSKDLKTLLEFRKNHNKHWKALKRVLEIFPEGLNYDVHHPYLFNKEKLKALFEKYDYRQNYAIASLYCNEYKVESIKVVDNKIREITKFKARILDPNLNFLSTSNNFFNTIEVQNYIKNKFPNKSKYEK